MPNPYPTKRTEKVPTPFEKLSQFKGLLSKTISTIKEKLSFWGVIVLNRDGSVNPDNSNATVRTIMSDQNTAYVKISQLISQLNITETCNILISQTKSEMKTRMSIKSLIINIGNKLTELDSITLKKGSSDNLFTAKRNDKRRGAVGEGASLIFHQKYLSQHNEEIKQLSGIIQSISNLSDLLGQSDLAQDVIGTFEVQLSGLIHVKISKEMARDKTIFNWAYNNHDDQLDLAFQGSLDKSKDKSTNNSDPLQLLEEFKVIKNFFISRMLNVTIAAGPQGGGAAADATVANGIVLSERAQNIRDYELEQYDDFDKHYLLNLLFKSYLSRKGAERTDHGPMFNLYNLQTYFYSEIISQKYLNYYNILIQEATLYTSTVGNNYRRCLVFFYVFMLLLSPCQRYEWFNDNIHSADSYLENNHDPNDNFDFKHYNSLQYQIKLCNLIQNFLENIIGLIERRELYTLNHLQYSMEQLNYMLVLTRQVTPPRHLSEMISQLQGMMRQLHDIIIIQGRLLREPEISEMISQLQGMMEQLQNFRRYLYRLLNEPSQTNNNNLHISLKGFTAWTVSRPSRPPFVRFSDVNERQQYLVSNEEPIKILYSGIRDDGLGRYFSFMIYSELIDDYGNIFPINIKFYLPLTKSIFINFVENEIIPCILNMFSTEDFDNLFSGINSSICVYNNPECHNQFEFLDLPRIGMNVTNIDTFTGTIKVMNETVHEFIQHIDTQTLDIDTDTPYTFENPDDIDGIIHEIKKNNFKIRT